MQAKASANPTVPVFQNEPPPGTPNPKLDLSDMDRIHHMVAGDNLADIMVRLASGHKVKVKD